MEHSRRAHRKPSPMEATSPATVAEPPPMHARSSPKRLVFDRRYGWVYDEWRDPWEQALVGGRGMFCIVPIGKSLMNVLSQSINVITDSAVEVLRNPNRLSLQAIRANLGAQHQKLTQACPRFNFKV